MNLKKQKSLGLWGSTLMGKVPHITGFWEEGKSAGKPDSEPILMDIDILEHHLVVQKWLLLRLQDGQGRKWKRWLEKDKEKTDFHSWKSVFFDLLLIIGSVAYFFYWKKPSDTEDFSFRNSISLTEWGYRYFNRNTDFSHPHHRYGEKVHCKVLGQSYRIQRLYKELQHLRP